MGIPRLNGTGKSTLPRTMAALQPALTGQVLIDGADITAFEAAFDGQTGWFATPGELAPWARQRAAQLADGPKPGLRPATSRTVADALADATTISAYFEVETGPLEAGWRPLTDLLIDPEPLSDRIDEVAERLNTTEMRVAASILFQGLAARLWSPVIGAVTARELLIDLAPAQVFWRPAPSGPLPLRAARLTGWEITDPERVIEPLYRNVVTELLEPLAQTVQEITKIAPGLLWGNAASALAGTVRTIARRHPELAARASALGRGLLSTGVLKGTGELVEPAPGHPFFVRRSCCLYYRLPDGGKCGDCALTDPQTRHEQWTKAVGEE